MTHLTYPREFPDVPIRAVRCRFDREPLGAFSRSAGGRIAFQEFIGGGLWQAFYQTKPLSESDYSRWHAWKLSLRGNLTFKGYDARRCYPIAYGPSILNMTRAGGGAFDGTVTITAAAGINMSLSGLPANFQFTVGDYLSFTWLGGQHLVKVIDNITANGSGIVTDLEFDPWLRSGGTVPTTGNLVRAWCEMKIIPGSWSGERTTMDPISFEAIQHLA